MDLDKTKTDTWNEIEALEYETKLLLEEVRGKRSTDKKQGKAQQADKPKATVNKGSKEAKGVTKDQKVDKDVSKDKALKKKLKGSELVSTSEKITTLNLFPTSRATVEILDDASPDVTPREADDRISNAIAAEKKKQQQFMDIEKSYRNLTFGGEQTRIISKADTFVPGAEVTTDDVHRESLRLKNMQETARLKLKLQQQEIFTRSNYLKEDRAALKVQSLYRGHLGRRQVDLLHKLRSFVREDEAKDWVEVVDKETGDVWYYNQVTHKSQWNKPNSLSDNSMKFPDVPTKKTKKGSSTTDLRKSTVVLDDMKTISVSMSLPSLDAVKAAKMASLTPGKANQQEAKQFEREKEAHALKDIDKELGVDRLVKVDALTNPDGTFKTQLRTVVLDALLDTRFDNVSTVLADTRWFEKSEEQFPRVLHKPGAVTEDVSMIESKLDYGRSPMVSVFNLQKKKSKKMPTITGINENALSNVEEVNKLTTTKELTLNNIEHAGFEEQNNQSNMCFGCWSAGLNRRCSLHEGNEKIKPSQTMLLCRNWDLDVMRRRYRSEEIQELFMKKESSLRYDAKHKKFHTVVEQRHPIYRMENHLLEKFNNRMNLFSRIKFWMRSMLDEYRQGKVHESTADAAKMRRVVLSFMNMCKVDRFSKLSKEYTPIAPITGYSWPERCGNEQYLFQHRDTATGEVVDIITILPIPKPEKLYLPRQYHLALPKTVPLPQCGFSDQIEGERVLPTNSFIDDMHPAGWLERMCSASGKDTVEMAIAQIKSLSPVAPSEIQTKSKRPPPSTIKFATIGQKPTPGMMAVGGLPAEMLIYQIISTHFPPQYGNFMVMDKASVSPGVSPEVTIAFESVVMGPTLEPYVERPLEHPLTFRRPPTISLNSAATADSKHVYGLNRPEQTGEQESHGFRTTAWAPQLSTFEEIDPQVFVPGQGVVSLNTPKANVSCTTHADHTYPFCEPSTRDNSTLDFYHLLLSGVVSGPKAQIFTALTVQEPGQFQKAYNIDQPMGHLVVNVYRSWAFTQQDTIQEFKTDDGISYWYHRKTGQTFWERPLYDDEESSPLNGGTLLDQDHPEEPSIITKGAEGATRRYLQGDFRKQMLMHIETKKDALNRRKAAASTITFAKQRGQIPEMNNSITNHGPSTSEMPSHFDFDKSQPFSQMANTEPSSMMDQHQGGNMIQIQSSHNTHNLMNMYTNNDGGSPVQQHVAPFSAPHNVVRGSNLDDPSWVVAQQQVPPHQQQQQQQHNSQSYVMSSVPGTPGTRPGTSSGMMPAMSAGTQMQQSNPMGGMMPGFDGNTMNVLSQSLGQMFATMMNSMDRSNPQDMIQLGLGMGMALMQTGVVNNMVSNQVQQENAHLIPIPEDDGEFANGSLAAFPSLTEQASTEMTDGNQLRPPTRPSRVSSANATGPTGPEPIGLPYPTAIYSSDKTLDHTEEANQIQNTAKRFTQPLNTMETARNLKIEQAITETPDVAPPKFLTDIKAINAESDLIEQNALPVVAYPELATQVPGGAPSTYKHKQPAGLGTSFVSKSEEESQLRVPGTHLRRTVMPLPVGFFDAIEARRVASQTADYLPQVPNLPQSRTIGRVKPRSAASDWLMISFDPWSAGKNPLSTEFIPSLMAKADRLLGAQGAEAMETLRQSTVAGAFIKIEDEEGLAQQRAEITKAQVLAQDFKKLCSLCRHSKFADAEQLINQPDWSVPVDYQDDQGNSLIHVAAQNGSKRLVKLCLRRGASLNIQNLTGQTPLHFAYGYGYTDVGDYLISKGADDSIRNKDGLTCYEGLGARELALL